MQAAIAVINALACLAAAIVFFFGAKNDQAKGVRSGYIYAGLAISATFAAGAIINLIHLVAL